MAGIIKQAHCTHHPGWKAVSLSAKRLRQPWRGRCRRGKFGASRHRRATAVLVQTKIDAIP
eukprot:3279264-Rhodomonas_salina.2